MMNLNLIPAVKDITVAAVNNPEFFKGLDKEEQIQQHYRDLIFTKVDNDQLSKEEENLYDGVNVSKEDPLKLVYTPTVGDNSDLGKEMIKRYNALWNGEEENNADLSESEKTTKTSTQLPNAKPKNEKAKPEPLQLTINESQLGIKKEALVVKADPNAQPPESLLKKVVAEYMEKYKLEDKD